MNKIKHCFSVGNKFNDAEFQAVEERAIEYAGDESALTNEHYAAAASDIVNETQQLLSKIRQSLNDQFPEEPEAVEDTAVEDDVADVEQPTEETAVETVDQPQRTALDDKIDGATDFESWQAVSDQRFLKDDLDAQTAFLEGAAKDDGYSDVEDLLAKNYNRFVELATQWRQDHPEEVLYSRSVAPRTKAEVSQLLNTGKVSYDLTEAFRREQYAEAIHLAKDDAQRKTVLARIARGLINTFVDSLHPVKEWINALPIAPLLKQQLLGSMYRADSMRSAYEKEVTTKFTDPMAKAIIAASKKTKLTTDAVKQIAGFWMSARYAPEANQRLIEKDRIALAEARKTNDPNLINEAQINLNQRIADVNGRIGDVIYRGVAGGLNNAEAAANLRAAEAKIDKQLLEDIAKHVYAMLDWKKSMDIREGKVTQQTVNGWLNSPYYVPLTGDPRASEDFSDVFNSGNRVNQQKDYAMNGRKDSIADDGIDAALTAVMKSINHASFQDFKRTLNEIYEKNPSVYLGVTRESISGMQRISDDVVMYRDTAVMKNGIEKTKGYAFKFDDRDVIQALRKSNQESVSKALSWIGKGTSLYARLVTQFTLMFAPINFIRDVWERSEVARVKQLYTAAGVKLTSKQMDQLARKAIAFAISPELFRATVSKSFKRNGMQGARPHLEELIRLGGMSTWGDYLSRSGSDVEDSIRNKSGVLNKTITAVNGWVEGYNNSFDMVSSLAVYMAAKEMGVAPKDAAAFTLDLMNFRKKGNVMPTVKALYVFAQPAAQSGYNLSLILSTPKGRARFAAYVLASTALYALMAAAWGDEDDEELGNKLDNLSNFVTDRFIPVKLGEYVFKIPVGFGLPQLAWLFGVGINRLESGRYTTKDALFESMKGAVKAIAPVSPSDIEVSRRPVDFLIQSLTPTLLKPIVNIGMDQTGLGSPMTVQFKNPEKMKYEQSKRNTPEFYSDMAKEFYQLTGNDIYPEHVKALFDGYFVGPFKMLMQIKVDNPAAEARGDIAPLTGVSQMVDTIRPRAIQASTYYRVRDDLESAYKDFKRLQEDAPDQITSETRVKATAYQQFKNSELAFARQRTALKKMTWLSQEDHDARLQAIEERATEAQRRVLLMHLRASQLNN